MNNQIYIAIGIIVLAIIAAVMILGRKKPQKPLSRLGGFAFAFVLAGVIFGESRLTGYGLMGIGIILAIIDIIKKRKIHE
jgi:drug/metabolite transporter (DMT)-like permease